MIKFGDLMVRFAFHIQTVLASTLKENQMPDLQRLAINSLSMDDQDTHDVFITVDDPRKHVTKMETYATYKVSTKVGNFCSSVFIVICT